MREMSKTERLNIRLTPCELRCLEALARRLAMNKTEAVVWAVKTVDALVPAAQEGEDNGEEIDD